MVKKKFLSLRQKEDFSHFVLHVKRRCHGLEDKRPFDLYGRSLILDKNLFEKC